LSIRAVRAEHWFCVGIRATVLRSRLFFVCGLWMLLFSLCALDSNAQSSAASSFGRDTTKPAQTARQRRPGIDLPDSLYVARDSVRGDIDTIVQYNAKDSIVFDVAKKKMILINDASMHFQSRDMEAYQIVMDFTNHTLTASSANYDSVVSSSLAKQRRIVRDTNRTKTRGAPILHDGAIPYEGEVIVYNFQNKRGTVQLGTTEMEGGFYYGERIKQVAPGTLFVENGRFTTCDAPVPHYYFESPRMKVIMQDQVFAEPVYLYVADVPIFALPFGVFPNHAGGRRTGVIMPNYQVTGDRGYGLTHLGWYQVFSDYFDVAARSDIFTKGGYNLNVTALFMQRYLLSGPLSLNVGYGKTRINSVDPYTENWLLQAAMPNLNLGPATSISANLNFQSSGYFRNNAQNTNDLLRQNVNSFASFSHNWEDLGLSLGVNYSRSQDLERNTYDETSPSITLSKTQFFPFAPAPEDATGEKSLLQTLGVSMSVNATRQLSKTLNQIPADTARNTTGDTSYHNTERYGMTYSPSISISPKLGYISITPSFNYSGAMFFRSITSRRAFLKPDSTVGFDDAVTNGFHNVYRYDMGVGMSTTLYGIANIGVLGIKAIRHTLQPTIGINFRPDFSDQEIRQYADPKTGLLVDYDIYQNDLNAGFTTGGKSANLSFGLGNDFEAKIEHEITKDSTSEEKVKLLNLNVSSAYDLIQTRFSPLNVSAYSRVGSDFSISGSASYSFYPANYTGGDSTDHTLIALGQGFFRATNASFSLTGSLSSNQTSQGENLDSLKRLLDVKTPEDEREMMLGGFFPGAFVRVPFRPIWNVSYGVSYTENYALLTTTRNFSATLNLTISPTRNWSFTTSASYDLVNKQVLIPSLRVHRDLHCWEMNFDYRPTGFIRGFNLEIRLKAPQLQDIKLTRTENSYGQF
jgi:hypothetical protein